MSGLGRASSARDFNAIWRILPLGVVARARVLECLDASNHQANG